MSNVLLHLRRTRKQEKLVLKKRAILSADDSDSLPYSLIGLMQKIVSIERVRVNL